jgi:hypothetical protein
MSKKKKDVKFEFGPNDKLTSKEKSIYRKSKEWITFRNQTIQKRGNKCEICGYEKSLTLHHVHLNDSAQSYTNLKEERFRVICMGCHRWLHRVERSYHRKRDPVKPDERIESLLQEFIIVDDE